MIAVVMPVMEDSDELVQVELRLLGHSGSFLCGAETGFFNG